MNIGKKIKERRKQLGLSAEEVAALLGVSPATIYRYESNEIMHMRSDKLEPLAQVLQTTPAYLMGWTPIAQQTPTDTIPYEEADLVSFPIIGRVAAGYNGQAIEEYSGETVQIPQTFLGDPDSKAHFALRVKGDSMYPKFLDGDIVLVHRQETVDNNAIAVLLYNEEEATIKKIHYVPGEDWLELVPINPEYQTKRISGMALSQCRILGRVVKLIRDI